MDTSFKYQHNINRTAETVTLHGNTEIDPKGGKLLAMLFMKQGNKFASILIIFYP